MGRDIEVEEERRKKEEERRRQKSHLKKMFKVTHESLRYFCIDKCIDKSDTERKRKYKNVEVAKKETMKFLL